MNLTTKDFQRYPTITSGIAIVDDRQGILFCSSRVVEGAGSRYYTHLKQDSKASFTESSRVDAPAIMAEGGELPAHIQKFFMLMLIQMARKRLLLVSTRSSWKVSIYAIT